MGAPAAAAGCTDRGRGRPRDPQTDERILAAALEHLAEHGVGKLSVDGVARAAGVSKATIYRRWSDKNDLVTAAVASIPMTPIEEFAGDTRARLVQLLDYVRTHMIDRPGIAVLHEVFAEEPRNPELARLFRERKVQPRRASTRQVLVEGIAAGDLREDLDVEYVVDLLAGSWMARWASGEPFPDDWSERVIATLWPAIAA